MTLTIRHLPSAVLAALALLAPAFSPELHALLDFPSDRITLETTATETYDSYMIGTRDHNADYITTFLPQLTYNHLVGPTSLTVYSGLSVNRYANDSQFNSNDLSAGISSKLPVDAGSRLSGQLKASYLEASTIDQTINDRVPTKTYAGDFGATYLLGLKTTLSDNVDYNRSQRKIYGNQTIWSNDARFTYADFLEDTNFNLGHNYTRTLSSASNYQAWAYNANLIGSTPDSSLDETSNTVSAGITRPLYGEIVGGVSYGYTILHRQASETSSGATTERGSTVSLDIDGPFLPPARFPKIKSHATISYTQSRSPGINDNGQKTIVGKASLSWDARERTNVAFSASRSTSLGSSNFTEVDSQVAMTVTETIGLATTAIFTSGYTWRSFRGVDRSDTEFDLGLSLRHPLNQYWAVGAGYTFQKSNTDAQSGAFVAARYPLENYTRNVVSAFVTFSY